jgi:putative transposase
MKLAIRDVHDLTVLYNRPMKTLHVRLKDKHAAVLENMAREVNFVWNYVNDLCQKHLQRTGKFLSAYDLHQYTVGATKDGMMSLHSQTLQAVNEEYVLRRRQFKKKKLRWRVSYGSRKSLGWIPFKVGATTYRNGQLKYAGQYFNLWDSYGLSRYQLRSGSFSQDSRGRWYANLCVETVQASNQKDFTAKKSIGIDLGLKDFATFSDGRKIEAERLYRASEEKLAVQQRANNKTRVKAIHAKIKNTRKDFLHKLSASLVKEYAAIFVGNVNAKGLAQTKLAKSVLDASWSAFRTMLKYKSDHAGVWFEEVNESFSTQTCSHCGSRSDSPKGRAGLGIREWTCMECSVHHDRDVNAAKNILARGHARLAGGILVL